jgi:2,5-diamino-6-(ribosylamino)-4(3H)-pyrimidinone 5'-phosphate reductase
MNRPFVFINVAMTADGKIDTFERKGAAISSARDKERVDKLRAESDSILVGGRTLLDEDPKLIVKSESLRAERLAHGLSANPMKVGIVTKADIKSDSNFLHIGPARIVIFTTNQTSMEQMNLLRAHHTEVFVHETRRVDLPSAFFPGLYTTPHIEWLGQGDDRLHAVDDSASCEDGRVRGRQSRPGSIGPDTRRGS